MQFERFIEIFDFDFLQHWVLKINVFCSKNLRQCKCCRQPQLDIFSIQMRHIIYILPFILTIAISCNNKKENSKTNTIRDIVAKEHLQKFDSSSYLDTADINYKVLKAYIADDTSFFKKLHTDIEQEHKRRQQWEANDSCVHQPSLQELNVDEVYRFVYTAAFCDYKLNVTISKNGERANIHFIILKDVWLNDTCKIINEYDKGITAKDWENFSQLMAKADFWGLKGTNGRQGLDGSTLVTTGFTTGYNTYERKPKYNYVYRWGYSTLDDPFTFVLKLSGNTQGCFVVK
jgi:hypothetical protein